MNWLVLLAETAPKNSESPATWLVPACTILFGGIMSGLVTQWIVRSRETHNAIRAALVKLKNDTELLAIEYIHNLGRVQDHKIISRHQTSLDIRNQPNDLTEKQLANLKERQKGLVDAEVSHADHSRAICLSSRVAIINVKGDLLSLKLLTKAIDKDLKAAVDKLLDGIKIFVPTSEGGKIPDPKEYEHFKVEQVTEAIEQAIETAWERISSGPLE